ncbi:MAG: 5'/3'-nucleotidase SurE [SAR202 cluster bacterium Casp-Chloro-G4]|nr:5'/3'-nucleotidase SurE [Chloroflexota bacterium]MDA1226925.1 5'/3'-nucleotidase SurE [Chloroflexota bacterium]PKB61956.1 MAG: 5'/3'-nucleotidase SurE [SAR202 cluster bacterium Casp-Chloro-G4]
MNILITNDDSVNATGLWTLARALQELGTVTVVAPDRDQSGIGAALTLQAVVRTREVDPPPVEGIRTIAVEGTPADCVVLAVESLVSGPIDLLVSGINQGSNLGMDVMVSGTFGGAMQGYFRNIPSIAISVASLTNVQYDAAALTAKTLAKSISSNGFTAPLMFNVNLPNATPDRIQNVDITRLGPRQYLENVERGTNGRATHYWIKHNKNINPTVAEGTDIWAIRNSRISITPMNGLFGPDESSPDFQVLADDVANSLGIA